MELALAVVALTLIAVFIGWMIVHKPNFKLQELEGRYLIDRLEQSHRERRAADRKPPSP